MVILLAGVAPFGFADWYSDVKSGCTWVEIKGDDFVADTFCSVDALYSENGYYYQCNERIMRFYREAYGLEVLAYSNTGLIMLSEGYDFVEAKTPKKGDIIYVTAAMRNSSSDHWAIVKDYSGGYITMFEQNVIWDGKAAVNRKVKYPSDSYYLLTPVSTGTAPAPVLKGVEKETSVPKTEAIATTTEIRETTTKPVTEPTTKKAEKTVTVARTETTTAAKVTETTENSTLSPTEPTSEETILLLSETAFELTESQSAENNEAQNDDGVMKAVLFAFACVLLAAVAAISIVIIKKRK